MTKSFELADNSEHAPRPAWIYAVVVLLAFVWRFWAAPWDFGGCFFQTWVTIVSFPLFVTHRWQINKTRRAVARILLLPIATLLQFGSIYFAVQSLIPFVLAGLLITGILIEYSNTKKLQAGLVSLLLIPIGAFCLYGAKHMVLVARIRSLRPDTISELLFIPQSDSRQSIRVTDTRTVTNIVSSLSQTTAYSPNHESIRQPWLLKMTMHDGSVLSFEVGNGNRAHRDAAWIQFGVEVYQNPQLAETIRAANLQLW